MNGAAAEIESLLEQYGNLLERYESQNGFQWETEVEKAMTMLGIGPEVWPVSYRELSGGQKTKVMLSGLLVSAPKFYCSTSPRTIWTVRVWSGWSSGWYHPTKAPCCLYPMTGNSSTA